MSERRHTPGPWRIFRGNNGFIIGIGEATGEGIVDAGIGIWRGEEDEAEANAHLVASAPDMLEALEAAIEVGLIPKSTAKDGGPSARSEQVRVADMVRAALSRARAEPKETS